MCAEVPTVDPWWVATLVEQLPIGSAYQASLSGGPDYQGWDLSRYLLADVFDAVQQNTFATAVVAGAKGLKPPQPWPRPGTKRKSAAGGTPMRQLMKQVQASMTKPGSSGPT